MNWAVVRQKGESQKMKVTRKESTPNFPKNEHFLSPDTHTYVCVSGSKKCLFFRKLFSCYLCFENRLFVLLTTIYEALIVDSLSVAGIPFILSYIISFTHILDNSSQQVEN